MQIKKKQSISIVILVLMAFLSAIAINSVYGNEKAEGQNKIAFFSQTKEGPGIYVINANGKGLRKIVKITNFFIGNISWSPDGRKIAFVSQKEGHADIYMINADGSQRKNLTNDEVFNVDPSFSPNGKKIVFCSI